MNPFVELTAKQLFPRPSPDGGRSAYSDLSAFGIIVLCHPIDPKDNFQFENLWSHAAVKICADGGANALMTYTQERSSSSARMPLPTLDPPDAILGDLDSLSSVSRDHYTRLGVHIELIETQDHTDLQKCLYWCRSRPQYSHIKNFILYGNGSHVRLDHLFSIFHTSYLFPDLTLYFLGASDLAFIVPPSDHPVFLDLFIEWLDYSKVSAYIGLIPLAHSSIVTTTGLKWNLINQELSFATLVSTSNTFESSVYSNSSDPHRRTGITIKSSHPILFTLSYSGL